ncbi:MAG: hypothetical protein O2955_22105 [Planctomycetota bacterium]|nr:hypothetical protein [Planctomycetota bacterium]MDA1215201.1 hypothetical protein [Planctomycetota bacterium]
MKPQIYKDFIDRLVDECHSGQGAIGPTRARSGIWNQNATADFLVDQYKINQLLASLDGDRREVIAGMLAHAFQDGVFETLKALETFEIEPFLDGYEGSPYHDFVGRVAADQWQWPEDEELA